jgi:hypothetical protein
VELIIREKNTYAAQKIQARSFIPLRSRMQDWKPSTKDKMYVSRTNPSNWQGFAVLFSKFLCI